jgi:hypothetical protein
LNARHHAQNKMDVFMKKKSLPMHHGVMEGEGAYNKHAKLPAGGASLALPMWERAIRRAEVGNDRQVFIADYGSSQAKNSLLPARAAVNILRERVGADHPIFVFHIDQAANDFNTLFKTLDTDPESYCLGEANVFPAAIGRSFYETVLPSGSVHLGWCSYAIVWLSHIPAPIPGHFIPLRSVTASLPEFEQQAARDWEKFLSLRARELRTGGRIVVVLPALPDDGISGFENLMNQANNVISDMVADRTITADERAQMVVGAFPRRRSERLAPLEVAANSKISPSKNSRCTS